jgi:hypothetical protein
MEGTLLAKTSRTGNQDGDIAPAAGLIWSLAAVKPFGSLECRGSKDAGSRPLNGIRLPGGAKALASDPQ